jgi:hypothetical protein
MPESRDNESRRETLDSRPSSRKRLVMPSSVMLPDLQTDKIICHGPINSNRNESTQKKNILATHSTKKKSSCYRRGEIRLANLLKIINRGDLDE